MVYSQEQSIEEQILNYPPSKSEIISRGRRMLLDYFLEKDYEKVSEIRNYLMNKVVTDDYLALYPAENWLTLFWTREYETLLEIVKSYESPDYDVFGRIGNKILPSNDLLYTKLYEKSTESRLLLITQINDSEENEHRKDFLRLHLNGILTNENNTDISQDMVNDEAEQFIKKYPKSVYEPFIRKYIRFKYKPSKWGFAFEFFSGYSWFTGALENDFKNGGPIGVAFDAEYRKLAMYFRNYIGFSKTREDLTYSQGIWPGESQVRVFLPEASIGLVILDSKRLKMAPFVGIASTDIGATEFDKDENPDLRDAGLEFTTTYVVGYNMDIKLGQTDIGMVTMGPEQAYWFLRIRYAYNAPRFDKKYGIDGNMHYVTIGLGGFGRKLKRDL